MNIACCAIPEYEGGFSLVSQVMAERYIMTFPSQIRRFRAAMTTLATYDYVKRFVCSFAVLRYRRYRSVKIEHTNS